MSVARDLELYLVRHAPAAERGPDWPDDDARPLTPDGARSSARPWRAWPRSASTSTWSSRARWFAAGRPRDILAEDFPAGRACSRSTRSHPAAGTPRSLPKRRASPSAPASRWSDTSPTSVTSPPSSSASSARSSSARARCAALTSTGCRPAVLAGFRWFCHPRMLRRLATWPVALRAHRRRHQPGGWRAGGTLERARRRAELAMDLLAAEQRRPRDPDHRAARSCGELARGAVDRGARVVVAWGGDGTVNEVATALAGPPPRLA